MTVEAAFVTPIFGVMALGAIDGANLFWQSHRMETQLAIAGKYLSKTRNPSQFETGAKRLAVTGRLSEGHDALIPNWEYSDVSVNYRSVANTKTADGFFYRGGNNIRIVLLTSQVTYSGLGFINSVSNGTVYVKAAYEERIVGDDAA